MLTAVLKSCSKCGAEFSGYAELPRLTTCARCIELEIGAQLEAWKAEQRAKLDELRMTILIESGMAPKERTALTGSVPLAIKKALPRIPIADLLDWNVRYPRGFGLIGGQGIGKTMALAAVLGERAKRSLTWLIDSTIELPDPAALVPWYARARFKWVNWPDAAEAFKSLSTAREGGAAQTAKLAGSLIASGILVVDDLGRERMRGGYDEDLAAAQLDRIIDARNREQRAIFWTSNLSLEALSRRYGAAMISRLLGIAPAVELASLPDMRLSG